MRRNYHEEHIRINHYKFFFCTEWDHESKDTEIQFIKINLSFSEDNDTKFNPFDDLKFDFDDTQETVHGTTKYNLDTINIKRVSKE